MHSPLFLYNIAIEGDSQKLIDWGNSPRWLELNKELIESANKISLIPKEKDNGLPIVTVDLDKDKRWVLFSRVYGQMTSGRQIRVYAIGWQRTVGGINIKSLQWVYPGGTIENADEPSFIDEFLAIA